MVLVCSVTPLIMPMWTPYTCKGLTSATVCIQQILNHHKMLKCTFTIPCTDEAVWSSCIEGCFGLSEAYSCIQSVAYSIMNHPINLIYVTALFHLSNPSLPLSTIHQSLMKMCRWMKAIYAKVIDRSFSANVHGIDTYLDMQAVA